MLQEDENTGDSQDSGQEAPDTEINVPEFDFEKEGEDLSDIERRGTNDR